MPDDAPSDDATPVAAPHVSSEVAIRRKLAETSHLAATIATLHGVTAVDDHGHFGLMTLQVDAKRWPSQPAYVHVSEPNVCPLLRLTAAEAEQLAAILLVAAETAREMEATPLGGEAPSS